MSDPHSARRDPEIGRKKYNFSYFKAISFDIARGRMISESNNMKHTYQIIEV
jgi:hypothetical protein